MRSRVRLFGHPLHPILVMVPIAVFPLLLLLDAVAWWTGDIAPFTTAGFWLAGIGALVAVIAMVPGAIDFAQVPDGHRSHRVGVWHAILGTVLTLLLAAAAVMRWPAFGGADLFAWIVAVDIAGGIAAGAQGYLGGELVYHHHLGVREIEEGGQPLPPEQAGTSGKEARRRPQRLE